MLIHKIHIFTLSLALSEGNTIHLDTKNLHLRIPLLYCTFVVLLSMAALPVSCDRHSAAWYKMDFAEEMMETYPDSALEILNGIADSTLRGSEETARYALLKSMALDKNYMDTTVFDVLQPAIDYYPKHGSANEKLRTCFYQGRIYQNREEYDSAMNCYMKAGDLKDKITDTLMYAHALVGQGTLYSKQYKIPEFVRTNIEAAHLYESIGKKNYEIRCYSNAFDGYVMLGDKASADSLLPIFKYLVQIQKDSEAESDLFSSLLTYTIEFGTQEEIKAFLDRHQGTEQSRYDVLDFAYGYSKIGEFEKASEYLSKVDLSEAIMDTLKYAAVRTRILENQGKYEEALKTYKDYSAISERYQMQLISQDLLFADKKHQLEMKNLKDIQSRNWVIWEILCGFFASLLLAGWIYYRYRISIAKRIIAEKDNANLKFEQENLRTEKEKIKLERDKKALEAENLEKDKLRLEAEQRQRELEATNLQLEKLQLENERDNLKKIVEEQAELGKPIQEAIKVRVEILNSLLAKEITNNAIYAKPYNTWIESVRKDKNDFMNSTRLAFSVSHPHFMNYLEQCQLTTNEMNYLCLYAIGLRGKEVGEYIQMKSHYNISSEIRKKLGINEHETNIGLYIRRLMNELEK